MTARGQSFMVPSLTGGALVLSTLIFNIAASPFTLFIYNTCLLAVIGAVALNLLMGAAGQVSIGNAAFLATGAFGAVFAQRLGLSFPFQLIFGVVWAAAVGLLVYLPALRIRGIYLALATLSAHFIVIHFAEGYQSRAVGESGFQLPRLFGRLTLDDEQRAWSWLLSLLLLPVLYLAHVLLNGRTGRAWRMIRDHEAAAPTLGINVGLTKLTAFVISSALVGLQGALHAQFSGSVSVNNYTLIVAIAYISMILIGGLDTFLGPILGAIILVSLPYLTAEFVSLFTDQNLGPQIATMMYGLLIIVFIVSSPKGIIGLIGAVRQSWGKTD